MQKILQIVSILIMLTPLQGFADTTPPEPEPEVIQPTHFGDGNYPVGSGATMNEEWFQTFSKTNCRATIEAFPFGREVDTENNNIRKMPDSATDTAESVYKDGKTPNAVRNNDDEMEKLVAPCQCFNAFQDLSINLNSIFSRNLGSASNEEERTEQQDKLAERLEKRYWIEDHLLNQYSMCRTINVRQTKPTPPATGPNTINYCIYKQTEVDDLPEQIRSIESLITLDLNKDCKIEGNKEKCQENLKTASVKCALDQRADISNELQADGKYSTIVDGAVTEEPVLRNCSNIRYFGCLDGNKPEYLDIEKGFTSESLNVNAVLKTTGQTGFQGIENQGAGDNNPAINFILKIINTLSNLSFLVSVFFLIMGGFYLVIASGNSEMTDKGKTAIKNFIFAITFTLLSYTIVIIIRTLLYS